MKSRVYTHKPRTLNDLKEAIRQEIRPIDRHLFSRVMDDLKKKGLKTACKKTVGILAISFLKLNHPVWHVLSFNFVYINVNLLEKQLITVYFKDVRFPRVTLYYSGYTRLYCASYIFKKVRFWEEKLMKYTLVIFRKP